MTIQNPVGLVRRLWRAQSGRCFHCGLMMRPGSARWPRNRDLRWSREHLYPRSTSGRGMIHNIVLAHRRCNTERGNAAPTEDQLDRARRIYAEIGLTFAASDYRDEPAPASAIPPLAALGDVWPRPIFQAAIQGDPGAAPRVLTE